MAKSQHKFYGAWCSCLRYHMERAGYNQSTLADAVGQPQNVVSGYVCGRSKFPLDRLEEYARVLRLSPQERDQFRWLALEAYTPTEVWERLRSVEERLDATEQRAAALESRLAQLVG